MPTVAHVDERPAGFSPGASLLDVDWRFLLPRPPERSFRRLLLLGASAAVARQVEAVGLAREVTLEPTAGRADAVVCLRAAGLALHEVVPHLDASGALYYEGRGRGFARLGASPEGARRSLQRLGLSPRGLYWVHPSFTGSRAYFPLDVEHAVEWYASSLHSAPTHAAAAAAWAVRRITRLDPARLARIAPRIAVVAVMGTMCESPRLPVRSAELPEALRHQELHPLVLVRGDEQSRVVALPFGHRSQQPLAVVKLHRRWPADNAIADEQATLGAIRMKLDSSMRATVPEPLGAIRSGDFVGAVESFLPGERLHARWARRRLPLSQLIEDLELTTAWLAQFHLQSRVELRAWTESDVEQWVEAPLSAYERVFGSTAAESRLFTQVRGGARGLVGRSLPIVWQHGDFSSLNVFRRGGSIHVVDWEAAVPGLPLDDLLYFVTRWLYHVRDAAIEETAAARARAAVAFRQLFLEPDHRDPAVDAARAAIDRYVRTLEIDPRFLPLLLLHPWLRRAAGRFVRQATPGWNQTEVGRRERRRSLATHPSNPREGNRYVAQVGILAERERLFASTTEAAGGRPRR